MRDAAAPTVDVIRAAQSGDEAAFEEIVAATSAKVYALCLRLSGDEHDARDIMQETYLRVFRSLEGFRFDAAIGTWIYRIAANCAATHVAQRRARTDRMLTVDTLALHNTVPDASGTDPAHASEASEDRALLKDALGALPFSLRSVVVLADVYDFNHQEIAAELGISRAAVKVRLHRARRRLHDVLRVEDATMDLDGAELVTSGRHDG